MNDSGSSTESLRKNYLTHAITLCGFFSGLMNGKSARSDKQDENEEEFDIARLQYPVEVPEDDLKTIRTILLTSEKIVSLSVLLLKAKIRNRSEETAAAAGKRLLSYLSDKGLGEKQQYYHKKTIKLT